MWLRWAAAQWRRTPQVAGFEHDYPTRWQHDLFAVASNFGTDDGGFPVAVAGARHDVVYAYHHCAVDTAPSHGNPANPPNQVLIAIALFLSLFIMTPTLTAVYDEAVNPYVDQKIAAEEAMSTGSTIMKSFMIRNTPEKDLVMFSEMAGQGNFEDNADVPMTIVLPAFITSELKSAFQIGFLLFLPFLVIDMVIASILMSLGMMMLSPMLVALPSNYCFLFSLMAGR